MAPLPCSEVLRDKRKDRIMELSRSLGVLHLAGYKGRVPIFLNKIWTCLVETIIAYNNLL